MSVQSYMRVVWVVVCFLVFFCSGCVFDFFALRGAARRDVMLPLLFRCVVSSLVSFFFGCAVLARGW